MIKFFLTIIIPIVFGLDSTKKPYSTTNEGFSPRGGHLIEYNSRIYGTTARGGTNESGTIFSLNLNGGDYQIIHEFSGNSDGKLPYGTLLINNDIIWGTTVLGGNNSFGIIYSVNTDGSDFQVIHRFSQSDGREPYAGLIEFNNQIWGSTLNGGDNAGGVIFSINSSNEFNVEFDFNYNTGSAPIGELIIYNDKFWGIATSGMDGGSLFSFDPISKEYVEEYNLLSPHGALFEYEERLYGVTSLGGQYDNGTIFSFSPINKDFIKHYDFSDEIGSDSRTTPLIINGYLYGMTLRESSYENGSFYRFNLSNETMELHYPFEDNIGSAGGDLAYIGNLIWGFTSFGSCSNGGALFNYVIASETLTKIFDFINGCENDSDNDSIIDADEDLNSNENVDDDDTDMDNIPNYLDADDDNDGILTIDEDYNNNGDPTDDDTDNSGVPDYLEMNVALNIDYSTVSQLKIYPNPSNDFVYIKDSNNDISSVSIFDVQGKHVNVNITRGDTENVLKFSAQNLSKGIYLIKIKKGIKLTNSKLIIK